ncbi:MAG: hypothetical protein KDA41_02750, partial [Planctomycetales bacterium]|nr:hypothetical protein [Planctomycetales bacterium]
IQNAMASQREFTVPPTKEECLNVLGEMIRMMAADGELATVEKTLCASAAVAMEISPQEFKNLLASMT